MKQEAWEIAYKAAVEKGNKKKWELHYKQKAAEEMYAMLTRINEIARKRNDLLIESLSRDALDKAEGK